MERLSLQTKRRNDMIDVTAQIRAVVTEQQWKDGAIYIYCPHTTGAITINEGFDPDVVRDVVANMSKLVPHVGDYAHAEGNSDSHIKASMFGAGQWVMIEKGALLLGRWQKIFFCEFDGPRSREIWIKYMTS